MPRQKSQHVDSPAACGKRVRYARTAAGLSLRDLSFTGCSAAYISRIERGERTPSIQILRELGRRLGGVSENFLATGDTTQPLRIVINDPRFDPVDLSLVELFVDAVIKGRKALNGLRASATEMQSDLKDLEEAKEGLRSSLGIALGELEVPTEDLGKALKTILE